jgi:hypothetical protein
MPKRDNNPATETGQEFSSNVDFARIKKLEEELFVINPNTGRIFRENDDVVVLGENGLPEAGWKYLGLEEGIVDVKKVVGGRDFTKQIEKGLFLKWQQK